MSFPTIPTNATGNSGANATQHTITMPSGIVVGELLLVLFTNDGSATVSVGAGANWNLMFSDLSSSVVRFSAYYKFAEGGDSLRLDTSASEGSAWIALRISGAHASQAPDYLTNSNTGTTATPDCPSNTAAWGVDDNLWLPCYGWDGNVAHSSYPVGYDEYMFTNRWANSNGCGIACGGYAGAPSSVEDPGTAALATSEQWAANTIAIRPAPPGAGNVTMFRQRARQRNAIAVL